MTDLHETSLAAFLALEEERRISERDRGTPGSYSDWPRDLLVRWRQGLAQLRLVRSVIRQQGGDLTPMEPELTWVDDRWFELTIDGDTGSAFYLLTPDPNA